METHKMILFCSTLMKKGGGTGEGEGEGYVEISRLTIITVLMAFRKVRHIPFSFLHIQSTIGQSNCHLVTFVEIKKKNSMLISDFKVTYK